MGRRRCCCGSGTVPTRSVAFGISAPCGLVPGQVVGFTVRLAGSPVATGTFTTSSTGVTPTVSISLPNGSYTVGLDADPARFVRGASTSFTVTVGFGGGPTGTVSIALTVASGYVCFSSCRGGTLSSPPPLPTTLVLTDPAFGATTLTHGISGGRQFYSGSRTVSYGECGCATSFQLSYSWPDPGGAVGNCNLVMTASVRSDGCFSNTALPDSILIGRVYFRSTTTPSAWPILVQSTFTAPDCTQLGASNHMPHPAGSVTIEITE